jgi:hypothetical protein
MLRVPTALVVAFLNGISDFVLKRSIWGGEVLTIHHDYDFKVAIYNRYIASEAIFKRHLLVFSDYFLGKYSEIEKTIPKFLASMDGISPIRNILSMPLEFINSDNSREYNIRKIKELPLALARSGQWMEISVLYENLDFLLASITVNVS